MKNFYLNRKADVSGVSGTGRVAEGVIFHDGRVALRWLTETASTATYDSIEDVEAIHCHGGTTEIVHEAGDPEDLEKLRMRFEVIAAAPKDIPRSFLYQTVLKLSKEEAQEMMKMAQKERQDTQDSHDAEADEQFAAEHDEAKPVEAEE